MLNNYSYSQKHCQFRIKLNENMTILVEYNQMWVHLSCLDFFSLLMMGILKVVSIISNSEDFLLSIQIKPTNLI